MERPAASSIRAWVTVFGSSLATMTTIGFTNAFGIFQEYFKTFLGVSDSDISWIGSVSLFLLYILGPLCGILCDKFGPTPLLVAGSIGELLAIFMLSLCTKYYQVFLTQGLLLGISMSFITCPVLAVVSRHMPHRRGLALGITIGGSSIGGVLWPIMLEQLLKKDGVSFGWTIRALAFVMMPLLIIVCLTVVDTAKGHPSNLRGPEHDSNLGDPTANESSGGEKTGTKPDFSLLRNRAFILLCLGLALCYLGLLTPLFYITTYAIEHGISASTSFYLLSIVNATSFFGRVIPGQLADTFGHFTLCIMSMAASAIIGFCWTGASGLGGLIIWCLAYGFTSGAVMSLQGACAGKLASQGNQGMAVGFLMGSISATALVGTPISGQILRHSGYLALSIWTGATLIAGAVLVTFARLCLDRRIRVAV